MTKEFHEPNPKENIPKKPEPVSGVLAEEDRKKLERSVLERFKRLGSRLTKKEINSLISQIETAGNLEALKEKISGVSKEKSDELLLSEILDLAKEIRESALAGIEELRMDVGNLLKTEELVLKKGTFPSERFAFVKRLEKSELGTDIVLDIVGLGVGLIDSLVASIRLILILIRDFFLLPKDLYDTLSRKSSL